MSLPENLKYTSDHEWIKLLENDEAVVGITDFAQQSLGDITFVETPEEGDTFDRGATFGVVESVKAASDLYMPVDAAVIEGNSDLEDAPEQVNQYLSWGAGPRASQYLIVAAKCHAAFAGKYSPDIENVRAVALPILRHRIVRNYKAEAEGITVKKLVEGLV